MNTRILIMGLPGSGKTTLATALADQIPNVRLLNADKIRAATNDWDFSIEGRIRQAHRMKELADEPPKQIVIADFVCGLIEQRDIFRPHLLVWMNTIQKSRYEDTNALFHEPCICGIKFDSFEAVDPTVILNILPDVINRKYETCHKCSTYK